jgi:hypothetical protein
VKPCRVKIVDKPFDRNSKFLLEVNGEEVDWPILSYRIENTARGTPKLHLEVWVDEVEVDGEVELHPLLRPVRAETEE